MTVAPNLDPRRGNRHALLFAAICLTLVSPHPEAQGAAPPGRQTPEPKAISLSEWKSLLTGLESCSIAFSPDSYALLVEGRRARPDGTSVDEIQQWDVPGVKLLARHPLGAEDRIADLSYP